MYKRIRNAWVTAGMGLCAVPFFVQAGSIDSQSVRAIPSAIVPADATFAPGSLQPFAEIAAPMPSGVTTLTLSGVPATSQPQYATTALMPAKMTTMQLGVDPDPAALYASPNGTGRQFALFNNPTYAGIDSSMDAPVFIVEAATSNASAVTIYVGIDSNADGQPQQSEQVCQINVASNSSGPARCVVDLRATNQANLDSLPDKSNVWVLVDVPQGTAGTTYTVSLATQFPLFSFVLTGGYGHTDFIATGPGQIAAGASVPVRIAWGDGVQGRMPFPGQRYFGAMAVSSSAQRDTIVLPLALTYTGGEVDRQEALSRLVVPTLYAASAQSFHHVYVDVPPSAATLTIDSNLLTSNGTGTATLALVRADFPDFSASPQVAAAPVSGTAAATWTLTASTPPQSTTIPVTPGRWYVTVQTSAGAGVTLRPDFTYADAGAISPSPGIAPGAYYNPQRSGHGLFLSQANGQQALYWYTYLEDGTPTWYMAEDAIPDPPSSVWNTGLSRINWNGSAVNSSARVGDVTLTSVDGSDMIFSWHLDGLSGSERFTRLGAGACPQFNGAATNFNGTWYVPAQSGFGMDVLALPNLQFAAFYFYDALGIARWGTGTISPFSNASTMTLTQMSGFCPACDYRKVTAQPLGKMTVGYDTASSGSLSANLSLQAPLSGTWTVNAATTARLTGSPQACTP